MIPNICYRPSSLRYKTLKDLLLLTIFLKICKHDSLNKKSRSIEVNFVHPTHGKILLVCCRAPLVKLEPKVLLAPLGPGYVSDWKLRENLDRDCFL